MSENKEWEGGETVQSNWFKFINVGDMVKGTLLKTKYKQAEGIFGAAYVYELMTDKGIVNVSIAETKTGTNERLQRCKIGEIVGVMFEKEIASKNGHPAKALVVKSWGMNPTFNTADGSVDVAGTENEEISFE